MARPYHGSRCIPVRHLREEAFKVLAARARGAIDGATATMMLEIIQIETSEALERNKEFARSGYCPPPRKVDSAPPGRPWGVRPPGSPKPYWRRPIEERRPYTIRAFEWWARKYPERYGHLAAVEERLLDELGKEKLEGNT
jgi:hypothetical protein